jgi:hypothetical protein
MYTKIKSSKIKIMAISNPKAVENSVNAKKISKAIAKKIESSTLSVKTIRVLEPNGTPLSEIIFILSGSPPAEEGVIAARNMLESVVRREKRYEIL